jgi:dTDP-4-dehydrorhamnose 3,5-epimerase-like enzyme
MQRSFPASCLRAGHHRISAESAEANLPREEIPMSLEACKLIDLPKINDPRGNLTFIESSRHIPFDIKRVYYLYDVPGGALRAGHAHRALHQFLIAMSGSFDITVDDSFHKMKFHLNRSYYGLYIPPMIWREIDNFSSGSVCVALVSEFYDEADYFRHYPDFIRAVREPLT